MDFKNFEEFSASLFSDLQESAKGNGGCIKVEKVPKNNRLLTGISFHKEADSSLAICPTLYAEYMYADYERGVEYQDIITHALRIFLAKGSNDELNNAINELVENISDKGYLLKNVQCCFIREEGNGAFMEKFITVPSSLEGLRLFFYVPGMLDDGEMVHHFSLSVDNVLLKKAGISADELQKEALKNTKDNSAVFPMELVILAERMHVDLPRSSVLGHSSSGVYCMTNHTRNKMSTAVLSQASVLAGCLEDDLYIAMMSVDEAIAVPFQWYVGTEDKLREIAQMVNSVSIDDTDCLTDAIYLYSRTDGTFKKIA